MSRDVQDLTKNVIIYRGPLLEVLYDTFFNPNMCHVCKSSDNGKLISCRSCDMISYCNKDHKKRHEDSHRDICEILTKIVITTPRPNYDLDGFEWVKSRELLLEKFEKDLGRPMKDYEEQMILRSKVCIVCHRENKIYSCDQCFSVNYCLQHWEEFRKIHTHDQCREYTILLNIEIQQMSGNCNVPFDELFSHSDIYLTPEAPVNTMKSFISKYLHRMPEFKYWEAGDYVLSDWLSWPLTLYSMLKNTHLLKSVMGSKFIIHVIGMDFLNKINLRAWEILFHLSSKLCEMMVVCIDSGNENWESIEIKCCKLCTLEKKKFCFLYTSMLYDEYLKSPCNYKEPNIIIIRGTEFDQYHLIMSPDIVNSIRSRKCPLFISCFFEEQAESIVNKIKDILDESVEPTLNSKNFFRSYKPCRNLETDGIVFSNKRILFYSSLEKFGTGDRSINSDAGEVSINSDAGDVSITSDNDEVSITSDAGEFTN